MSDLSCPMCGSLNVSETCIGFLRGRNPNKATCLDCEWSGPSALVEDMSALRSEVKRLKKELSNWKDMFMNCPPPGDKEVYTNKMVIGRIDNSLPLIEQEGHIPDDDKLIGYIAELNRLRELNGILQKENMKYHHGQRPDRTARRLAEAEVERLKITLQEIAQHDCHCSCCEGGSCLCDHVIAKMALEGKDEL